MPTLGVGATANDEQESTLKTAVGLLGLIRRHLVLVLTVAAVSVGGLLYKMRHELPAYKATAVIRLEDKGRQLSANISRTAPMNQSMRPFVDPVLSQIEILRSRNVAQAVVEKEGLQLRALPRGLPPDWARDIRVDPNGVNDTLSVTFEPTSVTVRSQRGQVNATYGQPIVLPGVAFTIPSAPGISTAHLVVEPLNQATNEVAASLVGRARDRTDVIDVSYMAPDPLLAQRIVNGVVRIFQSMNATTEKQESVRRREFIEQQLEKVEQSLAEAQAAHNAFQSREKVYSSQDKLRGQQADLARIDLTRQQLEADRSTYASLLNGLQGVQGTRQSLERLSALAASPGIAENAVVAQLFAQLLSLQAKHDSMTTGRWGSSPNNPDVVKLDTLIATTQRRVVDAVRAQVTVLDARVQSLQVMGKNVAAQLAILPSAEAQEATLQAQVETYGREADRLREELQSAQIAEAAEAGQVEIVDLATPGTPMGTGKTPKLVVALILGIALGAMVAYVLENYRPVIRRRDELEHAIALPNLAMVPQIRSVAGDPRSVFLGGRLLPRISKSLATMRRNGNGNGAHLLDKAPQELVTVVDAHSNGAEAYRTLRTNLLFSAAVHGLKRVVITSPGPAEGKSTTAANLAIAFAQQGHKALLVDCDLRRSRVHKLFQQPQTPGLTNVLLGSVGIADAIRPTRVEGLMIMPSGPLPPNPAELLGSPGMRLLLDKLSENYELLILDSPPLLAASDAAIISRMVDGALVVVRAGRTERAALLTAVQQLTTVGARVLGTVLNDPDAEVPKYARYYSHYYNNYYEYSNGNGSGAPSANV